MKDTIIYLLRLLLGMLIAALFYIGILYLGSEVMGFKVIEVQVTTLFLLFILLGVLHHKNK